MIVRFRSFVIPSVIAVGLLVLPGAVMPVSAWGAVGHRVVARIAWALLTPAAQTQATALLEPQAERLPSAGQEAFVIAATWADEVRSLRPETYNWHFVNLPVGETRYDATRDCPPTEKGDCVVAEIARARAELIDASRPAPLRAEALKYLIHFVGDLHQPLHAIDNHDRGGNDVKVAALRGDEGRATNLHSVWDTGLINLSSETEAARADRLLLDLKVHPPVATVDAVKWAEESHGIGVKLVYRYPSFALSGPGPDPITLDEAYRAAATTTIDGQLGRAGARLAALVNSLLK